MLRQRLDDLAARGLYRHRRVVGRPRPGARAVDAIVDGCECLTFCSNDYLGLAQHPLLTEAFVRAARTHGVGSGASHLITGHHREHRELEEALATFTGRPRALLFSTGYMANLGIASALLSPADAVFEDQLNHASLLDAGRLRGARFHRYPHGDAAELDGQLRDDRAGVALVMTDGVFSMDGDVAPLSDLASSCARHHAWLVVDDAHGLGVLGATGRGSLEHCGLRASDVPVLMGTLGKAFGVFGAFVAGSEDLVELLIQRARTYIYTTALPPAVAAAARAALGVATAEPWRRERVLAHAALFRTLAAGAGITVGASATPIQPVLLGDPRAAVAASEALLERGLLVTAIRPPTVPAGTSRLRVTFSAEHTTGEVERLVETLSECLPEGSDPQRGSDPNLRGLTPQGSDPSSS
jgi:8-amino-7-oxononanoate synthase